MYYVNVLSLKLENKSNFFLNFLYEPFRRTIELVLFWIVGYLMLDSTWIFGTKYSRMDQVKFVEDSLEKFVRLSKVSLIFIS